MEEEVKNTELTEEEKQNWRAAKLQKIRSGNRKERRAEAKRLRRTMKAKGVSRAYAVKLSKKIVRKHG